MAAIVCDDGRGTAAELLGTEKCDSLGEVMAMDVKIQVPKDGTHGYFWEGARCPTSVSGLIEENFERFDADAVVAKFHERWWRQAASVSPDQARRQVHEAPGGGALAASTKAHVALHRASGMSVDESRDAIVAFWAQKKEVAASFGTAFHLELEHWCKYATTPTTTLAKGCVRFIQASHLKPVASELKLVVLDELGQPCLGGCLDLLAQDENGDLHIVDFKTCSSKIMEYEANYGKFGLGTLREIPDTKHSRYSVQQSIYWAILESYGVRVKSVMLLQVNPNVNNGEPRFVQCADYRKQAFELITCAQIANLPLAHLY